MPLSILHQGETGSPLVCRFHDHIPDKWNHRAVPKPVGERLALVLMQGGMCPTNRRQSTVLPAKPASLLRFLLFEQWHAQSVLT